MAERQQTPQAQWSDRSGKSELARRLAAGLPAAMLDDLPVAIWMGDERGRPMERNAAAQTMAASEMAAVPPGSTHDLTVMIQARLVQALQTRRQLEPVEIVLRRSDGTRSRALLSAAPVFSDGQIVGSIAIGFELTKRPPRPGQRPEDDPDRFLLLLSDALRPLSDPARIKAEACRRLGAYLDADRVAYVELVDGEAVVDGQWAAGLPPLPAADATEAFGRAFPGDYRQPGQIAINDVASEAFLTQGQRAAYEKLHVRALLGAMIVKGGQWIAGLVVHSRSPRTWAERDPALVTETAERVWAALERTRAEELIHELLNRERSARTEAEQALRIRDEFLAMVSHELRTPLAAILLWSRLAQDGTIRGREREAMETIERNALEQQVLVEDLLEASRMFSGTISLDRKPLALAPLARLAVEDIGPAADERQIWLGHAELDREVAAEVDSHRFIQILRNLLDNSIRYSKAGGRVEVAVRREGDEAVVEVRDTGWGIPADLLPHIFDRFRRGADSGPGGLGLGLTIAHDLVALHGGTITAESDGAGTGATFTVRLPAVELPAIPGARGRGSRVARGGRPAGTPGR